MKKYLALIGLFVVSFGSQALASDYTFTNMISQDILVHVKVKGASQEKTIAPGQTDYITFPGSACLERVEYMIKSGEMRTQALTRTNIKSGCGNRIFTILHNAKNSKKIDFVEAKETTGVSGTLGGTPVFTVEGGNPGVNEAYGSGGAMTGNNVTSEVIGTGQQSYGQ